MLLRSSYPFLTNQQDNEVLVMTQTIIVYQKRVLNRVYISPTRTQSLKTLKLSKCMVMSKGFLRQFPVEYSKETVCTPSE